MPTTDLLAALVLVTAFMALGAKQLATCVRAVSLQALALAAICVAIAARAGEVHIYLIAFLTFGVKAVAIPYVLNRVIARVQARRDVQMIVGLPGSLIIGAVLVGLAYSVSRPFNELGLPRMHGFLAVSISLVLLGLLIMITRRKAITQTVGLLIMENGVFLTAMSTTAGLPLIVELGVFLDVLIAVLIIGVLVYRINDTFEHIDTARLSNLRG